MLEGALGCKRLGCEMLRAQNNNQPEEYERSHDTHVEVGANRRGEYDVPAILVESRWE